MSSCVLSGVIEESFSVLHLSPATRRRRIRILFESGGSGRVVMGGQRVVVFGIVGDDQCHGFNLAFVYHLSRRAGLACAAFIVTPVLIFPNQNIKKKKKKK